VKPDILAEDLFLSLRGGSAVVTLWILVKSTIKQDMNLTDQDPREKAGMFYGLHTVH